MSHCPKCGFNNEGEARFCGACGSQIAPAAPVGAGPQAAKGADPSAMKTLFAASAPPSAVQPVVRSGAGLAGVAAPGGGQATPGFSGARTAFASPRPAAAQAPEGAAQGGSAADTLAAKAAAAVAANAAASAALPAAPAAPALGGVNTPGRPFADAPKPNPAAAAPQSGGEPLIGRVLNNRYRIDSKIGEGGFGAVFKGTQLGVGREVALKLLHPNTARDPNLVARFRREGAVACNLRDPHTITTYDFDQTEDGLLYIAMELLKGRSLHDVFHAEGTLKWRRVIKIMDMMSSSLGEAHAQGIVHRDIKPENIVLEDRAGHGEFVKILDFGIAKIVGGDIGQNSPQLTATGQTLGTLEYMSPEQLMGRQLDGRSDIYALGVLAYELMTGQLPFPDATGPAALIAAQLRKIPVAASSVNAALGIPPEVDALLLRMLDKERDKRFADMAALRVELHMIMALPAVLPPAAPALESVSPRVLAAASDAVPAHVRVGEPTEKVSPLPKDAARVGGAASASAAPKTPTMSDDDLRPATSRMGLWIAIGLVIALAIAGLIFGLN